MTELALIGGSGLSSMPGLELQDVQELHTPYGDPSGPLLTGRVQGCELHFLARHGEAHHLAPHQVNYRANLWALHQAGARRIIGINTVGAIAELPLGSVVVPDQLIDYSWGREHSFSSGGEVLHIDFTVPFDEGLRTALIDAARALDLSCIEAATYAATQGPRLETAAEVDRLERDGCDIVGMTLMPEAALARELGIAYACCSVVVNAAAGRGGGASIDDQVAASRAKGVETLLRLLNQFLLVSSAK